MTDIVSPPLVLVSGRAYRVFSTGQAPSKAYRQGDDEDVLEEELYEAEQAAAGPSSARAPMYDGEDDQDEQAGPQPVDEEDLDLSQVTPEPKGLGYCSVVSCDPAVRQPQWIACVAVCCACCGVPGRMAGPWHIWVWIGLVYS